MSSKPCIIGFVAQISHFFIDGKKGVVCYTICCNQFVPIRCSRNCFTSIIYNEGQKFCDRNFGAVLPNIILHTQSPPVAP